MAEPEHLHALDADGHVMLRGVAAGEALAAFRDEAERLALHHQEKAHGIRHLLHRSPVFAAWARSRAVLALLPPDMQPVRSILFDKTPETNWKVAWHQDLTIAVQQQHEAPGYGPWSVKEGTVHVQTPVALLEAMVTLRLHLDDTPATNGALKVLPGSHRHGRLEAEAISRMRQTACGHVCEASAGDLLLMKPLILHASSASSQPGHRRVVHVEYAPVSALHPSLRWTELGQPEGAGSIHPSASQNAAPTGRG